MADQGAPNDRDLAIRLNGYEQGSLMDRIGAYSAHNPDVPRNEDLEVQFQREVADLLGRGRNVKFPGAQPVSFSRKHIEELKKEDYYVTEKTDGSRFLLWATKENQTSIHYLIDRQNRYFFVPQLFFPHHESKDFSIGHSDTILDGELVEDRQPNGTTEIKFYVFDCLVLDGNNLMQRPLDKRLAYFNTQLLEPYKKWCKAFPDAPRAFKVQGKQNEFSYAMEKMFKETIPKIKELHGNDGLIFTCKDTPYCPGTDPHILKWKSAEENTVDWLLHIEWATHPADPSDPDQSPVEDYDAMPAAFVLYVNYGQDTYQPHGHLYVSPEEWESLKRLGRPIQDSIIEAYLEDVPNHHPNGTTNGTNGNGNSLNGNGNGPGENKRWRFHRFRDDKEDANHISTYESVIDSIEDRVTEEELIREAGEIRMRWKARAEARKGQR